jgi:Transposase DDE domain group 1
MRLILHTAAYWLMLAVRNAIPGPQALASGEFSTIRLRLLKVGPPFLYSRQRPTIR